MFIWKISCGKINRYIHSKYIHYSRSDSTVSIVSTVIAEVLDKPRFTSDGGGVGRGYLQYICTPTQYYWQV